jgi:hypothetical protein
VRVCILKRPRHVFRRSTSRQGHRHGTAPIESSTVAEYPAQSAPFAGRPI